MLETYFSAPKTLGHLRAGPSGPYMDGFAASLERDGYRDATAVRYLRAAAHLGAFSAGTRRSIDRQSTYRPSPATAELPLSAGRRAEGATITRPSAPSVIATTLCKLACVDASATPDIRNADASLVAGFRQWLQKHRGAAGPTVRQYSRGAADLMMAPRR